jgi:hypothetical protein
MLLPKGLDDRPRLVDAVAAGVEFITSVTSCKTVNPSKEDVPETVRPVKDQFPDGV